MKKKDIIIFWILFILLFSFTFCYIFIKGDEYTAKFQAFSQYDINDIYIKIEDGNKTVEVIDKKFNKDILEITFKAVSPGQTLYTILVSGLPEQNIVGDDFQINNGAGLMGRIIVHKTMVITKDYYFGNCTGGFLFPVSISILLAYVLYLLIKKYRYEIKDNIYQHRNIALLGLIIFLFIALYVQVNTLFHFDYFGPGDIATNILDAPVFLSLILLPVALITSILVIISNVVLIKKEGFSLRNIVGVFLGAFLCFMTVFPNLLYSLLYNSSLIDVHNEQGWGLYLEFFVESAVYNCLAYIECILLATIILSIKAAKHIPKFDKDYIIILGCKVKKDGTLTNLLKGRVDRAIEFAKLQKEENGRDLVFVPSGGQGSDETISEGEAMKNYLVSQGIKEDKIVVENKSKNTFENLKFSYKLISEKTKDANIAFSTTNYHVFRSGIFATEQNIKAEGIGAKTKTYFWINAFIREFIATLVSEKKNHIILISLILIFTAFLILMVYFNNTL